MTAHHERPMAAAGLTSYRCRGRYGWIMIGATDAADAMREARRSTANPRPEDLEVWDGTRYVPAESTFGPSGNVTPNPSPLTPHPSP